MLNKFQFALVLIVFSLMVAGCTESSTEVKQVTAGDRDPDYRGSWAQVPVILSRIKAPSFPNRTLIITDAPYNAKADGSTDARQAIQNAIIDVSRFGGGTVSIPRGEYYVDGPLNLENNVNLHLQELS